MPAISMAGAEITTIEGLDPSGNHPVQKAWNDEDVPQCGYCQGGQILTASALLQQNPNPSDQDIDPGSGKRLSAPQKTRRKKEARHENF
jgi:isoquinoline 1-oxidoreductase alpha subunit